MINLHWYETRSGIALVDADGEFLVLQPPYGVAVREVSPVDVERMAGHFDATHVDLQFQDMSDAEAYLRSAVTLESSLSGRDLGLPAIFTTAIDILEEDELEMVLETVKGISESRVIFSFLDSVSESHLADSPRWRPEFVSLARRLSDDVLARFIGPEGSSTDSEWRAPALFFGNPSTESEIG